MSDFHASVARIHVGAGDGLGPTSGSGFLVGPDLLVTCAHVVGAGRQTTVRVCFPQATGCPQATGRLLPQTWRRSGGGGCGVPAAESGPGRGRGAGAAVGTREWRVRLVRAFGFPAQAPPGGHPGTARVGQFFTTDGAGGPVTLLGLTDANALAQGFSGSPLVDGDGLVVGMVTAHPGADPYGAGASILPTPPPPPSCSSSARACGCIFECPYPGLAPFACEQSRWFHGRACAVDRLLDLVRIHRGVLALLGPSGSGKSSLVAAGLLPDPRPRRLPGTRECRVLRPSTDPAGLAEVLAEVLARGRCRGRGRGRGRGGACGSHHRPVRGTPVPAEQRHCQRRA